MKKSAVKTIGFGFLILTLLAAALWFWRQSIFKKRAEWSAVRITHAIEAHDFVAAKSALNAIQDPDNRAAKEKEIRGAEFSDAIARRDAGVIRLTTSGDAAADLPPDLLEKADLVLAREALWNRDFEDCGLLVDRWIEKSAHPGPWTLLSADLMLARGKKEQAREFLEAAKLVGEDEALRHARLALIQAREPWKAMESRRRWCARLLREQVRHGERVARPERGGGLCKASGRHGA